MSEHILPKLAYAYDALEPYIDAATMETHYSKHHQTYTNKFNDAISKYPELLQKKAEDLLANLDLVPEEVRAAVRNNGGGYVNHSLFWQVMSPSGGGEPGGELAEAINRSFESFVGFKEQFSNAAVTLFGSGWIWLVVDGGELKITAKPNQDSPLADGQTPILLLDVWEHAYYLKYKNKRPDYIEAWWNVVDWKAVADKLAAVK